MESQVQGGVHDGAPSHQSNTVSLFTKNKRERDQTPYHGPEMIGLWAFGDWALTSCCLWTGDDWLWAFGQRLGVDLMEELHAAARERRSERYGRVRQEEHTTYYVTGFVIF
jgi:hypothetical protein